MAWNLMLILFVVCLVMSAVGFYKFVYFLSVGYGLAIAGGAIAIACIYPGRLDWIAVVQLLLFVCYGIRLSGFLIYREVKSIAYQKTLKEVTKTEKPMPFFVKAVIWITVAILYTAQVSPVFYRLHNQSQETVFPIIGMVISLGGLILEAAADRQKSAQKAKRPDMVATEGLYRLVRCPNYLGEILFWTGVLVGAIGSLTGAGQWVIAIAAYVSIVYIMFNGAQRLEKRQMARYGDNPEYNRYADSTPILLPWIPLYHLNKKDR